MVQRHCRKAKWRYWEHDGKNDVGLECSLEVALAWCISPNQLVFGYNPNFPSVMPNKPPALEGVIASKLIALHLNVFHSARKRFIESEAMRSYVGR